MHFIIFVAFDQLYSGWNRVLETVSSIGISTEILFDLFEHIYYELLEMNEIDSARSLLYNSFPLQSMKTDEIHKMRYCRLEQLLINNNGHFSNMQLYGYGVNKEKKRKEIAENMEKQLFESSPHYCH